VSFIRLSAFSLAHIGLFAAVFALAESLSRVRGGGAWYWLTLIAGNIVIILLEGLIASIQAIRLEYYEVFSKFFKGGGEEFRPLEV
jgi:V/A-type H+-transporting ATPase subunit I